MRVWILAMGLAATPAGAEAADWSLTLSGGLASIADEGEQPFVSASLYHYRGAAYVRGSVSVLDGGGEAEAADPVPASTTQLTLGGGYQAGRLLIDAYGSWGRRDFDAPRRSAADERIAPLDSDGSLLSLGGSLTWDAPVGERWAAAPFVALSYSEIDTALTFTAPGGTPTLEERRERGVTGIAGFSGERVWDNASMGLYLAAATTSNEASVNRQGSGPIGSRTPQPLGRRRGGESDSWIEFGLSGAIEVGGGVSLDAAVVRTEGFGPGETTSISAGIRLRL